MPLWVAAASVPILALILLVWLRSLVRQAIRLDRSAIRLRMFVDSVAKNQISFKAGKYPASEGLFAVRWGTSSAATDTIMGNENGRVTRNLIVLHGSPVLRSTVVEWSGQVFAGPEAIGRVEHVALCGGGSMPAWYFPATSGDGWVIHVHGSRVDRASPLRGVSGLPAGQYHSLVISYRGDGDGPAHPHGVSTLGLTEWLDIEPAIEFALQLGAKSITLMGWSMGGAMALLAAERSYLRHRIDRLVLVGPVTDWRAAIVHRVRSSGLPGWIGKLTVEAMGSPRVARIVGCGQAIDFESLDWLRVRNRVTTPCLVIHSEGDDEIPFALSEQFARMNESVTIAKLPHALHTLEWNRSPQAFAEALDVWMLLNP